MTTMCTHIQNLTGGLLVFASASISATCQKDIADHHTSISVYMYLNLEPLLATIKLHLYRSKEHKCIIHFSNDRHLYLFAVPVCGGGVRSMLFVIWPSLIFACEGWCSAHNSGQTFEITHMAAQFILLLVIYSYHCVHVTSHFRIKTDISWSKIGLEDESNNSGS